MKKSIISLFIGIVGFGALATSCEDMLTPDLERYATEFNGTDTVNFYVGILRNLQQVTEQNFLLGELRGDLVSTTDYVTDSVSDIANFKHEVVGEKIINQPENGDNALLNRAAYYKVINQCNFYLNKVDSLSKRNNHYYMRKEAAQVLLIRAWTYMQLVQNYGKVPFITEPVNTSTTGWETNPSAWATPDNLLSLLKHDMDQAWTYCETEGYPNYSNKSNFNTGLVKINHQLLNFDADVVYGDLYLLCGQSRADFEKAAEHYFNFLYKNNRVRGSIRPADAASVTPNKRDGLLINYKASNNAWQGDASKVEYTFGGNEIVTGVPSAANSNFGIVLSRIPNIYGFEIHSSNRTTSAENSSGETEASTSGSVTVRPNYRVRQVEPSAAYTALNQSQLVICNNPEQKKESELTASDIVAYTGLPDARMYHSAPKYSVENQGDMQFIAKFCGASSVSDLGEARSFSFRYLLPLYRFRTIMLRYAEALNRAGFPEHAFAILRNGLNLNNYPTLAADTVQIDTLNERITLRLALDKGNNSVQDNITYISDDELARASEKTWISGIRTNFVRNTANHIGLHQSGCGKVDYNIARDTLYNYATQVYTRLAEEQTVGTRHFEVTGGDIDAPGLSVAAQRLAKRYVRHREEGEGDGDNGPLIDINTFDVVYETPAEPLEEEMLAMELLIADEYALETAFEGNRFYDLMRIARHLNTFEGNNYGTDWLAWKIARRGEKVETLYENPTAKDGKIYQYLLNPQNWYIQNPKY